MTWAITAAAVIGAGTSLYAANKQSKAAGNAAQASLAQGEMGRSDLTPYRNAGELANQKLLTMLGLGTGGTIDQGKADSLYNQYVADFDKQHQAKYGMSIYDPRADGASRDQGLARLRESANRNATSETRDPNYGSLLTPFTGADLQNEPGYQFTLAEGNKAIDRAAAADGRFDSGQTLKELTRYGTDYAGTKFNDAFNRDSTNKSRTYGFLSGQQSTGANAAAGTAGIGANATNAANSYLTQGADASAAGLVGVANAASGGVGNYLGYQSNLSTLNYLKGLRNGGSGNGWTPPAAGYGGQG